VTGRVLVAGDLVTDVVVRLPGRIAPGSDTPAQIRLTGGGQAANTAAWLARCGVPVTLAATVGDDPAGRDRVAELAAAGVDCAVRRVSGTPTGTLVVLSGDGDRTMLTDRGAADRLAPADLVAALAGRPDLRHLHLSGYLLLGEGSRAAGRYALAAAAGAGLTTSVDAASAEPLRRVGPARFLDWIGRVDLLLANATEAAQLAGLPPPPDPATTASDPATAADAAAAVALADRAAAVVVKLGPAGALWAGPGGVVRELPPPAAVVDPTGAGDAFAAGLLAGWLAGADPAAALRAGVRLGAEAVAILGARPP
jgi:sugar/nucleoside kinase (ribokinase family)